LSLTAKITQLVKEANKGRKYNLPDDIRELTRFVPRPLQAAMQKEKRRFNSWVVHRRFGKSVLAVNDLIECAVECPFDQGRYAYAGPTYAQVEDIVWTYLKDFTEHIPGRIVQESKLAVWVPTRRGSMSRIRLYGTDTPKQRLRGMYLDGVVFDEWAQIPPSVWAQQVRPMLSDVNRAGIDDLGNENQWATFIFTPYGKNHAYKMHERARLWAAGKGARIGGELGNDDAGFIEFRNDWSYQHWRASETGILVPAELRAARLDMEDEEYEQEYECSFDAAVKGAIYAKKLAEMRSLGRMMVVPYNPHLPVHTGWDLGNDDATAIWFVQVLGNEVWVIDYYEANRAGLDHYAEVLAKKGYRYGRHYLPHDVEVVEMGTNKSRAAVLRDNGVRPVTVPRHKVEDGIAAVRALLPRCYWDETNTGEGLDRLGSYHREFDERAMVFRQQPKHDWTSHGADALRTLAMGLRRFAPDPNDDYTSVDKAVF
jgi:phage terminase large subunit